MIAETSDSSRRRRVLQLAWTVVLGFVLGGLLTALAVPFLPESSARTFLTTTTGVSLAPSTIDLIGVTATFGFGLEFNVLTLVGVGVVAFVIRRWL